MTRFFGTDGIRGVANADLTPDLILAVGRAAGHLLAPNGGRVLIGRDTRLSGPMLEAALVSGLCSAGAEVLTLGILPTPAVAFLTKGSDAVVGAVISASHNPVEDNGIKFFSPEGTKVTKEVEEQIEALLADPPEILPTGTAIGSSHPEPGGVHRYIDHLVHSVDGTLDGIKVVLDCAFGAAWDVAPKAFRAAGAEVIAMNDQPDGSRINVDCGSTSLEGLSQRVAAEGAHLGLAFDGDADRVLACDETGATVDGDQILALCALRLHDAGTLKNDVVVSTVMANLGFKRALAERGIEVIAAPVGDRHVAEAMVESGAVLGGEQSGHIIFAEHSSTGDGTLTGLRIASALAASGGKMSEIAHIFDRVPQVLINVRVKDRDGLEGAEPIWSEVAKAEESLGDEGRILLRASGTEPLIRVMVEALEPGRADEVAKHLASVVAERLA
jgi:phosphoglucosamine mutase